jgi:beta-mannosidase
VQLFRNSIPKTLDSISGQKPLYWQSSPSNGWGRKEAYTEGDVHYWGVWWGMEPFENYRKKVGRFVAEYGFQSMPNKETFQAFTQNLSFDDAGVQNHQKHKIGYPTIRTYMERDFPVPDKFEDFIYVSQLLQARGMQIAIEAHRTAKPYNMGTLFWQLNDVWPVTSWSSVDYFGRRKASHYEIKKAFEPLLISVKELDKSYDLYLVNDGLNEENGHLKIELKDFSGKIKKSWLTSVSANTEVAKNAFSLPKTELEGTDLASAYLSIVWKGKKDQKVSYYFVSPKLLKLPKPTIKIKQLNHQQLEITTDYLAKNIFLDNKFGNLPDNYFDLEAGEKKILPIESTI